MKEHEQARWNLSVFVVYKLTSDVPYNNVFLEASCRAS